MNSEKPCPFCGTPDCPKQLYLEDKRRNPPRGMGAGLWMLSGEFDETVTECRRRKRDAMRDDQV